jgi:hypothetical protein
MKSNMKTIFCLLIITLMVFPFFSEAQMGFTENKGQWDQKVLLKSTNGNNTLFLLKDGYTVLMQDANDRLELSEYYHGHYKQNGVTQKNKQQDIPPVVKAHAYKVKFINANPNATITKEKSLPGYENYFIGNDPLKWATGCKSYEAVTYNNIYDGIDFVYYVKDGYLKYDLIVHPGSDLSKIQLQYEGASSLNINNGQLTVGTTVGNVQELQPYTYQIKNGNKETVACKYKLNGNTLSFEANQYDKEKILIIDPSLVFSSYSGSTTDNWGFAATYGPNGSFFGAGIAAPTGFPVSTGVIQTTGSGPEGLGIPADIGIIHLSANGSTRLFATYLGGSGLDQPHSLIADANGNLVITGRTNSGGSFPGILFGSGGGYDIFVTKINANGTAIIGSTKIGGTGDDGVNIKPNRSGALSLQQNYGDDARSEVILDQNNNILLTSNTRSNNFYAINGFQNLLSGNQDGVVIKLNADATTIIWSSYLGGNGEDGGFAIAKNVQNNTFYVAGGTTSTFFPGTNSSSLQQNYNGGITDGYISRLVDNGSTVSLINSTYLGTANVDMVYGLKLDQSGYPFVTGTTRGVWPVINASYAGINAKQFISKIQTDLSAFVYSTTFGTANAVAPNISPIAFFVDDCENVYVAGWGGGANTFGDPDYSTAGTGGLPVTANAFQSLTDSSDFYMFVLQKNATSQLYGSFFGQIGGGGGYDHTDGGVCRFDSQGVLYLAACANCKYVPTGSPAVAPFPITPGVFGGTNPAANAGGCNLGMVKFRFDFSGNACTVTADNFIRNDSAKLSFFPNPNTGIFQVRYYGANVTGKYHVKIFNVYGAVILEQPLLAGQPFNHVVVNLKAHGAGVYFIEVSNAKGIRVAAGKILIE